MTKSYVTCDCCGVIIDNYDDEFIKFKKRRNIFSLYRKEFFSRKIPHTWNRDLDICSGCWDDIVETVRSKTNETMA